MRYKVMVKEPTFSNHIPQKITRGFHVLLILPFCKIYIVIFKPDLFPYLSIRTSELVMYSYNLRKKHFKYFYKVFLGTLFRNFLKCFMMSPTNYCGLLFTFSFSMLQVPIVQFATENISSWHFCPVEKH